jgi:hypothetical protein
VETDHPEVGVLIDAPGSQIPQLASLLSAYGVHASFSLAQASYPVEETVNDDGDQSLPRLPTSGLVRWLGTRGELHKLIGSGSDDHRHFLYVTSGPSIGQWLFAHGAGGRPVAGEVRLKDGDDSLGHLRPGEVVELSVANANHLAPLLAKLLTGLRQQHLAAVSVGRLMHDAGSSV